MEIALGILVLLCAGLGVVGAIIPMLPGVALSVVALLLSLCSSTPPVSGGEMAIYIALCVAAFVSDYLLPIWMTKRFGGSKSGMWGATIGMLVGFVAFPPFGVIIGPLFGAAMGELINDKENPTRAFKVAIGSFLSFIVSTGIKFIVSLWIFWVLFVEYFAMVKEAVMAMF